jgi:hypothetical protein
MEWTGLGWDGPPDEALVFGMGGGSKANSTPAGNGLIGYR